MFSALKSVWIPPESIYQHLYFKDEFLVRIDDSSQFRMMHYGFQLENQIFWKGLTNGWEKESIKLWIELCRQSSVILDIGANTGVYSLIANAVNPNAEVYAFEPVKRVYTKLKQNIALNGYDIHAFEMAVSNYNGEALIYDLPTEHIYSVTINKNLSAEPSTIETKVATVTLETFLQANKVQRVDLIKIDVETHEPEVLEGYGEIFKKQQPTVLVEILTEDVATRLNATLKSFDYLYFNIDECGQISQDDCLHPRASYNYLICRPPVAKALNLSS